MNDAVEPRGDAPSGIAPAAAAGRRRGLLLWVVPLVIAAGAGVVYFSGQRYVSSENAFVKTDHTTVSAEVSGTITAVLVAENQPVASGAPLLELDARGRRIEVQRAEARVSAARTRIGTLRAQGREKRSELNVARQDAQFADREYARLTGLAVRRLVAQTSLDAAERAVAAARGKVEILTRDVEQLEAQLGDAAAGDTDRHPDVATASAELAQALLDETRTRIAAPRAGVVARLPHVGDRLEAGKPALAIVSDQAPWIEANLKETELEFVRVGQPVQIRVDTYGGRDWRGRVASISQATGAEFAVIPAQNASGNWVKVVQRVPVRISLATAADDPPLRSGMSAAIRIDTGRSSPLSRLWTRPAP